MGETELGTENIKKAYQLRDRASDNEKFFITAYYDGRATGNQNRQGGAKVCRQAVLPRDRARGQ